MKSLNPLYYLTGFLKLGAQILNIAKLKQTIVYKMIGTHIKRMFYKTIKICLDLEFFSTFAK